MPLPAEIECCCSPTGCPPTSSLPDWEIEGFNSSGWTQYGDCCWFRNYSRTSLTDGIQEQTQDLYIRNIVANLERDYFGWWVRQNWKANIQPPVSSLYTTPLPNTCWNSYGHVATITYEAERENKARQVAHFQLIDIQVLIQQVTNTCLNEVEIYVRFNTTVRTSNQTQTLSYSRNTVSATILDACYEHVAPGELGTKVTGTKVYPVINPVWTSTTTREVIYKYSSLAAIPATLTVDFTVSPITEIVDPCFIANVCKPNDPVDDPICVNASTLTIAPYVFNHSLTTITDTCILSQILMVTQDAWSICTTLHPGSIPDPLGDMFIDWVNGCAFGAATGVGGANSSVSSCTSLIYNTLENNFPDVSFPTSESTSYIKRKVSCSPEDLIACIDGAPFFGGGKTYPVTNSFKNLSHTKIRTNYTTSPICMTPTTFSLT